MKATRTLLVPVLVAASVAAAILVYRLFSREEERIGGVGWIDQARFERDLRLPPVMGKVYAKNLSTHADLDVDVVSFDELDPTTLAYHRVKFAAPSSDRSPNGMHPSIKIQAPRSDTPLTLIVSLAGGLLAGFAVRAGLRMPRTRAQRTNLVFQAAVVEESGPQVTHQQDEFPTKTDQSQVPPVPDPVPAQALTEGEMSSAPAPTEQPDYEGEYYPVARAPRAFSLVELLVVLAVLTILLCALLPAVGAARRQAQTIQCAAQLKQIGEALHAYSSNNSGWLPAFSGWHTWPAGLPEDSPGPAWTIELRPYLGPADSAVYICPSLPQPFRFRSYFLEARWSWAGHQQAMKLSDVTLSGRFILSGDKTQLSLYPRPLGTSTHISDDADPDDAGDGDPVLAWPWQRGGFYMHRRGNNILFDDGHVATAAQFDPASMTFNPHRIEDWANVTPG